MKVYTQIEKGWEAHSLTETGTVLAGKIVGKDECLHVLYAPISKKDEKTLKTHLASDKKTAKRAVEQYIDFLSEHNGSVLYGGALVFFGATDNQAINKFLYPVSVIQMNREDYVSTHLNNVLYVGNAMHVDRDNINFYFNLENGIVSGYHKGEIVISWKDLNEFFNYIYLHYDKMYGDDGIHKFYGQKNKGVYYNAQLFNEEIE